jgi:hypothetical protein
MPIREDIKKRTLEAMKAKDEVARDVLRLAAGEIQMTEVRANKELSEDEAVAVVRKLVKSNEETLSHASGDRAEALKKEIAVLTEILPKAMSIDDLVKALEGQKDAIRAAGNDGQATGVAMKHLKASGLSANGKDVGEAVKRLRA